MLYGTHMFCGSQTMQLQKTYTSRGDGHYPAKVNEWFYGLAAEYVEGIEVTHDMMLESFSTEDFYIISESDEEIGEYTLSMVYSLPDFRNPETIIDTFTVDFNISVTKCEPLDLKAESDLPDSEYLIKYLEQDPPELTLPTWTYSTAAGVEKGCNATFSHELFAAVESPSGSGLWKEKDVDTELAQVQMIEVEPSTGQTQKVPLVKFHLNHKLEEQEFVFKVNVILNEDTPESFVLEDRSYTFTLKLKETCPEDTMRGPLTRSKRPLNMRSVLFETASQQMIPFYDEFTFKFAREDPCGKKDYYFVETATGKNITFLEIVNDSIWLKPSLSENVGLHKVELVAYLEDYPWINATENFTVRVLLPDNNYRVTLDPEFLTPLNPVLVHPGEEKVLTIEAVDKEDQILSIDVELGLAKSFVHYEIVDGTKVEFTITPSKNVKPYPYYVKIGLT